MGDTHATTSDRDHRLCFQRVAMPIEQLGDQGEHVMALTTQPHGYLSAGTSIDQEPHEFAIETASSESPAMTA